ncbi:MAG: hypothetical protein SFU85_09245 [Candidatus Methylacidiphilales bacterium]|nr:hypothetical protein [Candidatus Methylacidiphilales bacterium]
MSPETATLCRLLDLLQFACTATMFGIIWYVQLVHYPSFVRVREDHWRGFHDRHTGMTGMVVGPPILGETACAILAVALVPSRLERPDILAGLALLVLIWGTTVFFSIPAHHRLARGFDPAVAARLIATNWIRTAGWTLRFLLLLLTLARS